jgi:hypothetical protein
MDDVRQSDGRGCRDVLAFGYLPERKYPLSTRNLDYPLKSVTRRVTRLLSLLFSMYGGERGIRTPGRAFDPTTV